MILLNIAKLVFFYLLIITVSLSCSSKKLTPEKLVEYIQEESSGLKQTQTIGDFKYVLSYRPTDLIIWQEVEKEKNLKKSLIDSLRRNYEKFDYYILSISAGGEDGLIKGSTNMESFSENLKTLSFRMAEYTYSVTEKKDTLPLADFYFPRLYGMSGSTQIMLAYSKSKESGEYTDIYIEDIGLGTGRQVFRFKKKDKESVPALNY